MESQVETGNGTEDYVFGLVRELENKALEYSRVDSLKVFLVPQGSLRDVDVSDLKRRLLDGKGSDDGVMVVGGWEDMRG